MRSMDAVGTISSAKLAAAIRNSAFANTIIIDLRPSAHFYAAKIKGSVNVPATPSILKADDAIAAMEQQSLDVEAQQAISNILLADLVVLYDSGGPIGKREGPAFELAEKLAASCGEVAVLQGGFRAFQSAYASLCVNAGGTSSARGIIELTPKYTAGALPACSCLEFDGGRFRVWVGGARDASNRDLLDSAKVTHILNTAKELPNRFAADSSLTYLRLGLADEVDEDLRSRLDECCAFLDSARAAANERNGGAAALVHCYMGRSRSVSVTAAYAVHALGISVHEAIGRIKAKKPDASPNRGFVQQLEDWAAATKRAEPRMRTVRLSVVACSAERVFARLVL